MQRSLEGFRPKFLNDLIRIGNTFDGGYVVNERSILNSRYLISFGVNDDWSFETDFLDRKPDLKILCFDHSISKNVFSRRLRDALNEILSLRFLLLVLSINIRAMRQRLSDLKHSASIYFDFCSFFARKNIRFFPKGISNEKDQRFVTLDDVFQMIPREELAENTIFIKMDIEQSEFRVLPDLSKFEKYVNGMVIEFHDLDILWPNFVELMNKFKNCFEITHIHGNNFGGLIPDSTTPKVLEITLLKRSLVREEQQARESVLYPIPELDRPNNRLEKDYPLDF
jgi:hypothetical protein